MPITFDNHNEWSTTYTTNTDYGATSWTELTEPSVSLNSGCANCESATCSSSPHYVDTTPVSRPSSPEPSVQCTVCGHSVNRAWYLTRVRDSEGNRQRVCRECYNGSYRHCDRCDGHYPISEIEENVHGHWMCTTCMEVEPDFHYDDYEDDYDDYDSDDEREYSNVCLGCLENGTCLLQRSDYRCQLQSYNYRPSFVFHKTDDDIVDGGKFAEYLGFELEYNNIENKADVLRSLGTYSKGKMFYAKHDGSLDDGFEIVSHPTTLAVHETIDYDKLLGNIDGDVGGNCGLHIHVNKKSLGVDDTEIELVIAKLIILMNNLWDNYLLKVSRRSDMHFVEEYASELRKMNIDWRGGRELNIYRLAQAYDRYEKSDRYRALNLCNSNTIEFRFFESTFKKDDLMSCMEIVSKMIKYCKESTANQVRLTTDWKKVYNKVGCSERLEKYHARYCR